MRTKKVIFAAGILALSMANIALGQETFPKIYPTPLDPGWNDVTKYGADKTGKVDATSIIRTILKRSSDYTIPLQIYFPAGTYLVSDSMGFTEVNKCNVTFRGQGPEHSIIKLVNNAAAFTTPKAIFSTSSGNMQFKNHFFDLGINIGKGNKNAIGVDFIANNRGAMENIRIVSGDSTGYCGIIMERGWPGPCLLRNITVEGFDYGIRVGCTEYGPTFENITLKNQKLVAFNNPSNIVAIRNLTTVGTGKSLVNGNMAILLGANLGSPPIETGTQATTYYRDVKINDKAISDWSSQPSRRLFTDARNDQPLKLPVKETPDFHDNTMTNWFDIGSIGDKEAFNNGRALIEAGMVNKTTLYFPMHPSSTLGKFYGAYGIADTIRIPKNIRKIYGTETFLNATAIVAKKYSRYGLTPALSTLYILVDQGDSTDPALIIEGIEFGSTTIIHNCSRAIALKHTNIPTIVSGANAGDLFFEDVIGFYMNQQHRSKVWARQWNSETLTEGSLVPRIENNGGDMWVFGLKTEGLGSVLKTFNRGRTEVYGTLLYPVTKPTINDTGIAAFTIDSISSANFIFAERAYPGNGFYRRIIEETRSGITKQFRFDSLIGANMNMFIGKAVDFSDPFLKPEIPTVGIAKPPAVAGIIRALPKPSALVSLHAQKSLYLGTGVAGVALYSVNGQKLWGYSRTDAKLPKTVVVPGAVAANRVAIVKYSTAAH